MPVALILVLVLALAGCRDESKSEELGRQEREAIRLSEERKARLRTMRMLGFVILSGGAVGVLIWIGSPATGPDRSNVRPMSPPEPAWRDARPRPAPRRIIEIPAQPSQASRTQTRHTRNRP